MLAKEKPTSYDWIRSGHSFMVDRVAAIWVMRPDGTALLQHRDDKPEIRQPGLWVPPGGHAEPGETMLECARRELLEETEYQESDLQLLMTLDRTYDDGVAYQASIFWCLYDEVQTPVCHEGQELVFVKRSEAANHPMPDFLLDVWDAAAAAAKATTEVSP
jgi:8-oxo-dGTP pyrophosphatase MutT (NUDIX family)